MASIQLALLSMAHAAAAQAPKHVLVFYSHSRLVPSNILIDQSLSAALLNDSERPMRMHSEFLDEPEFGGETYEGTMVAYLHEKYAREPSDVIIAVADSALNFASAAPVYGPWLPFIGTGIVGGRMPDPEEMGTQAAQTVKALLAGTAPAALRSNAAGIYEYECALVWYAKETRHMAGLLIQR